MKTGFEQKYFTGLAVLNPLKGWSLMSMDYRRNCNYTKFTAKFKIFTVVLG